MADKRSVGNTKMVRNRILEIPRNNSVIVEVGNEEAQEEER